MYELVGPRGENTPSGLPVPLALAVSEPPALLEARGAGEYSEVVQELHKDSGERQGIDTAKPPPSNSLGYQCHCSVMLIQGSGYGPARSGGVAHYHQEKLECRSPRNATKPALHSWPCTLLPAEHTGP